MSTNTSKSILLLSSFFFFSSAQSTEITIVNKDTGTLGLNDTTTVTPVLGNTGTTKGQQAMNVFQAAADYWETRLHSPVQIKVGMKFGLLFCVQGGAVLGSAGANSNTANFTNSPVADTWYPIALARSLAGSNILPAVAEDIGASFNSGIGQPGCLQGKSWSYQISDQASPSGTASLYRTALHEIGHGLGFATLVQATGLRGGYTANGTIHRLNDNYMTFLKDAELNLDWVDMTPQQRIDSGINTGKLIWTGAKAVEEATPLLTAGKNGSNPRMYAPDPREPGSSVSHWDTELSPNELMEHTLTSTSKKQLTTQAFYDMHWVDVCSITKTLVANQWTQISLPCVAPSTANTVSDVLADDMTGVYGTDWVVYDYNPNTNTYADLGLAGVMESGKGYWIIHISQAAELDMPHNSVGNSSLKSTQCASGNDCFEIVLATQAGVNQWQMVGVPYRDSIQVADLRLKKETGASTCNDTDGCTFAESSTHLLADNHLWHYNGTAYADLLSGTTIDPWTGAWLATLSGADGSSPKLLIPKSSS